MTFAAASIKISRLSDNHDRQGFVSGKEALDRYLRQQASQDVRRRVASVFVAVEPERPDRVLGFFTLSAASVVPTDLPPDLAKRFPRHPIPAALIGRLAVAREVAGRGLGGVLLADAVQKAMAASETVAISVVVVDPLDDGAAAFYGAFGFKSLLGSERRLFLALARI